MSLKLNPGCSNTVLKNPLCPECKRQIIPVTVEENTVFICGCDYIRKFIFTEKSDMVESINDSWLEEEIQ